MIIVFLSVTHGSMAKTMIDWFPCWIILRWFSFYNYSAPQEKPLALSSSNATDAEIEQAITAKIKNAQVVLVIGGMYELYHKWMKYEVDEAMRMGKPIIAIMPWGQSYMPVELQAKATQIVGWNSTSIVKAIRDLA